MLEPVNFRLSEGEGKLTIEVIFSNSFIHLFFLILKYFISKYSLCKVTQICTENQ